MRFDHLGYIVVGVYQNERIVRIQHLVPCQLGKKTIECRADLHGIQFSQCVSSSSSRLRAQTPYIHDKPIWRSTTLISVRSPNSIETATYETNSLILSACTPQNTNTCFTLLKLRLSNVQLSRGVEHNGRSIRGVSLHKTSKRRLYESASRTA
jgi:hypothetical protein